MKKIYAVAHTHWDFEWYFTRQEAQVQFAFHMDDVLRALENNDLAYYLLDGQLSILEDYLTSFPEKTTQIKKYVQSGRLFVGPWYTQIDEMVTSGESIIRNLRLGLQAANELGHEMKIGYLPDSFGQGQDMPKIYKGFGIEHALFWRGLPIELNSRYFYWTSNDGSKVLTANIKNGYYAGVELIEQETFSDLIQKISTDTEVSTHLLPVGGDQRPVDFNFKDRLMLANERVSDSSHFIESNLEEYFSALEQESALLPTFSGEFIDPSVSKIHRGIYSSRYDLKQLHEKLESLMIYQVEPLSAIAFYQGIEPKQGLIDDIWKTIARGQAHDSSGGCNSDKTNRDIYNRAINSLQLAESLVTYLLRKLSISIKEDPSIDLFIWNPLPVEVDEIRTFDITTKKAFFTLKDLDGNVIPFDRMNQRQENAAVLRRNPEEMIDDYYYVTTIAFQTNVNATDWKGYRIFEEEQLSTACTPLEKSTEIENEYYKISTKNGQLELFSKITQQQYSNFLTIEDSGDEGDTYDYSPAFQDWVVNLDFCNATAVHFQQGRVVSKVIINGVWHLPTDLSERAAKEKTGQVTYTLELVLEKQSKQIQFRLSLNNQVLDHRMRLILHTNVQASHSYGDTPFGIIQRPVADKHLEDWKEIGYHEEPTSLRPMIHFANTHSKNTSWTFITQGSKDFQLIGPQYEQLAITLFRGVGFLGRPDLMRRPSDASGLQTKVVPTPDSQLTGELLFEGGFLIDESFNPLEIQKEYLHLTQKELFYQKQELNRFTTPLQYFMVNPSEKEVEHRPIFQMEQINVVFSSLQLSKDTTGLELRVYNPFDEPVDNPGTIQLHQPSEIYALNLKGEISHSLYSKTQCFSMTPFRPGEIRTYGIFPIK